MWMDIVVAIFIILIAYLGYRQGVLKQIFCIVAVALAFVFAGRLSGWVHQLTAFSYVPSLLLGAVGIYLAARIVFWLINSLVGKSDSGELKPWNRNLGLLFGIAKGAALAWAAACLMLTILSVLPEQSPGFRRTFVGTITGRVAAATNPFGFVERFVLLIREVSENPTKREAFLEDPDVQDFVQDERVQRILRAKTLRERLSPIDEDLIERAEKIDVVAALERAAAQGEE